MIDCKNEVKNTTLGSTCGEYPYAPPPIQSKIVRLFPTVRLSNGLFSEIGHFDAIL